MVDVLLWCSLSYHLFLAMNTNNGTTYLDDGVDFLKWKEKIIFMLGLSNLQHALHGEAPTTPTTNMESYMGKLPLHLIFSNGRKRTFSCLVLTTYNMHYMGKLPWLLPLTLRITLRKKRFTTLRQNSGSGPIKKTISAEIRDCNSWLRLLRSILRALHPIKPRLKGFLIRTIKNSTLEGNLIIHVFDVNHLVSVIQWLCGLNP